MVAMYCHNVADAFACLQEYSNLDLWGHAKRSFGLTIVGTHKGGIVCPHRTDGMMSKRQRGGKQMKDERNEISRREVLIGAGTIAAGTAVLATGVSSFVANAKASGTAYTYKKLNLD